MRDGIPAGAMTAVAALGAALLLVTLPAGHPLAAEPAAKPMSDWQILREADKARGNLDGIMWKLRIDASTPKERRELVAEVKARGFDVSATALAPPDAAGMRLLMRKGEMWLEKPDLSKAVPITPKQKLMSHASYGDIAATNYAEDYTPQRLGVEKVNGQPCWVFDLTAKRQNLAFDRIKYWVTQDKFLGIKAEYYTLSGQKWKAATMEYAHRVKIHGHVRPFISSLRMVSFQVDPDQIVLFHFDTPRIAPIPDATFEFRRPS